MTTLILISFMTIATYTAIVSIKSGIPYSISETYYRICHRKWFTCVMLFTAITILPAALEKVLDLPKRCWHGYCRFITKFYLW